MCLQLCKFCREGWPERSHLKPELKPYWEVWHRMSLDQVHNLLYGSRIIVPLSLQKQTLDKIHQGHQGIQRCRLRAQHSVWWPGVSTQVKEKVQNCSICSELSPGQYEPMIPSTLPDRPWQRIGADLFHLNGNTYLLVVDYFSRYPDVAKLSTLTSQSVITALKAMFSRHGIPDNLHSDNGPQFS